MANDDFSSKQIQTLTTIVETVVRRQLEEQVPKMLDARIPKMLDERFLEERTYVIGFFHTELYELKAMIQKLDTREDNDAKASVEEIEDVKTRLAKLEAAFADFAKTATHQPA